MPMAHANGDARESNPLIVWQTTVMVSAPTSPDKSRTESNHSQSYKDDCIARLLLFEQIIDLDTKVIAYHFRPDYSRWMIAPFSNRAMRKTAFLLDFVEGNTPLGAYPLEIFQNHRKSSLIQFSMCQMALMSTE